MADELKSIVTEQGKLEIRQALSENKTVIWNKIAVGDGNGSPIEPNAEMTSLVNQVWVGEVTSSYIDFNDPTQVKFHVTIPNDVYGFTIREIGILNDNDELMAVSRSNAIDKTIGAQSGGIIDIDIIFSVAVEDSSVIKLVVDPNIEFVKKKEFDELKSRLQVFLEQLEEALKNGDFNISDLFNLVPRVVKLEITLDGVEEFLERTV